MPTITSDRFIHLLEQFVQESGQSLGILLVGALALQAYGYHDRYTQDVDAELSGSLEPLMQFLDARHIPADLTQDIGGWPVVAMPPGYKERTSDLVRRENLRVQLLAPVDFIIANFAAAPIWTMRTLRSWPGGLASLLQPCATRQPPRLPLLVRIRRSFSSL